jgi:hypothetical protein
MTEIERRSERERPSVWESHRREQLRARASTTPARRLAWLEEAIAFARRAGALPGRSRESR